MTSRLLLYTFHFGPLPEWFHLFLYSCELNPEVDFLLITDQDPGALPKNVRLLRQSFAQCLDNLQARLGIKVSWTTPYKLCDLKPALACLYPEYLQGYTNWGYCDTDLIFGRFTRFYDDAVLAHDFVSAQPSILSGHLAVFRNRPEVCSFFKNEPNWAAYFAAPEYQRFDEHAMARLLLGDKYQLFRYAPIFRHRVSHGGKSFTYLFCERYSTFGAPQIWKDGTVKTEGTWLWRDGILTAPFLDNEEVFYVHFMHWKSARYIKDPAWDRLPRIVDPALPSRPRAMSIGPDGIRALA